MAKVYFKLGEKAGVFFDPLTRILINKGEVLEFEETPKSKKFTMARQGGHIVVASEADYNEYKGITPKSDKSPKAPAKTKAEEKAAKKKADEANAAEKALREDLEGLADNEEILAYFKKDGWLEEDLKKLSADLEEETEVFITKALDINREYNS